MLVITRRGGVPVVQSLWKSRERQQQKAVGPEGRHGSKTEVQLPFESPSAQIYWHVAWKHRFLLKNGITWFWNRSATALVCVPE